MGAAGLFENGVQLVLEVQLFFFQIFDLVRRAGFDVVFLVLDLLVQRVVLVEQAREMVVGRLELGDQFTVFRKLANSSVGVE